MKRFSEFMVSFLVACLLSFSLAACSKEDDETTTCTISFTDNSGYATSIPKSIAVDSGTVLSENTLPLVTSNNENATFDAWYTNDSGKTKLAAGLRVTSNITLTAGWNRNIVLNANGGAINAATVQKFSVKEMQDYTKLPSADEAGLVRDGYKFLCWCKAADGTEEFFVPKAEEMTRTLPKIGNVLYAIWRENTSGKIKVADTSTLETVLKSVSDGDTIVFLKKKTLSETEATLIKTYLSDSSKSVSLDLSFWDTGAYGHSTNKLNNCTSISSITIGRNVKERGSGYAGVPTVPNGFLKGCTNLKTAVIRYDYNYGNSKCKWDYLGAANLETITLGKYLTFMKSEADFTSWANLSSVTFEDSENWYLRGKDGDTPVDVTNSSANAANLKFNGSWYKSMAGNDTYGLYKK